MNDQQTLEDEIKALIVRSLNLEDVRPEEIETDAYGITLTAESEEARRVFTSVATLAEYIAAHRA